MRDRFTGRGWVVPFVVVVMLATLAVSQSIGRFAETIGVDFYHLWGASVARRISDRPLGPPYREGDRYYAALKQHAGVASQPKLAAVQRFWSSPDFTGSPLLYAVAGVVSSDYTFSLAVFRALQILSFVGACLVLGFLYRLDLLYVLCFAMICLLGYQPVLSDLRVANVACVQLGALAALMALASALPRVGPFARRAGLAALLLAGVAALTLCKANIALVGAMLAVHLAVRHGARLFAVAAGGAAVVTVLLLVASSLYFGSWTVWQEWYRFVYGTNPGMLVRPIAHGNYSTALLLSSWLGPDVSTMSFVLIVVLGASLLLVVRPPAGYPRGWADALLAAGKRLFDDPKPAVAIGILVTAAASPLFWAHYYVLVLVPSLWLLSVPAPRAVALLAAASVLMSAGMAGMLLWAIGWPDAMTATIILSWVPLWVALLIGLRRGEADVPERPTSDTVAPARSRRRRRAHA